jgi:hypothetical protein
MAMLTPSFTPFFEQFHHHLVALSVDLVEMVLFVGIDVENPDRTAVYVVDRDHDLGEAAVVARDMSGKGVDVTYDLGLIAVDGGPAHSDVLFENQAGDRTLVGIDHQLAVLEEVEAGPRDPRNLVVEEGDGGCAMGGPVTCLGDQLLELIHDAPIAAQPVLVVHQLLRILGWAELGIRNEEL